MTKSTENCEILAEQPNYVDVIVYGAQIKAYYAGCGMWTCEDSLGEQFGIEKIGDAGDLIRELKAMFRDN